MGEEIMETLPIYIGIPLVFFLVACSLAMIAIVIDMMRGR